MRNLEITDWYRLLIGETPVIYMLEVILRTLIIYFFLQVILRLMGKRMTGQLTVSEMAVMVTLGAIIAAPMQLPDRGLVHGIIILFCALAFHRGINYLGLKSSKIEKNVQGEETVLIKDGVLQLSEMRKVRISHQQIYAALRNAEIYNLGSVERAYLEACGLISLFMFIEPRYGLSIVPPEDNIDDEESEINKKITKVCQNCGLIVNAHCTNGPDAVGCNHEWIRATK
jgi:uncharacterized membrane protein YcaP (DUF421 family)